MSLIPQGFIDDLLDRVDIVEVIDSRVKLKKAGKNYLACCPFHKEKSPSFSVSPDKQFYYCFGCGASGTAVTFLLEYEHLNFVDAVETLARSAGMQVPREQGEKKQKSHKDLYTMLAKAAEYYQAQLKDNPKRDVAVAYLKQRGLTGQVCKDFGVGFAPQSWDGLQVKLGLNDEDRRLLQEGGMVVSKEGNPTPYDRFRNRIMFPILDVRGRTIGFGGRVLSADEKGPKYLNSPETPVFRKGRELYGLYQARQQAGQIEHLLVVEGYMDVIALAQFGITNAVATLGTACGEDHLKLAFKYTSEMVFCFDGDNAGRKAARRALENSLPAMDDGRQVKFLFLPEGQDPDTLVRQIGKDRFLQQIAAAVPLEEFFFDAVAEDVDVRTMEGRARMSKLAAPLLHTLPAGVYRELMFNNLAARTGLGIELLRELVDEPTAGFAPPEPKVAQPEHADEPTFGPDSSAMEGMWAHDESHAAAQPSDSAPDTHAFDSVARGVGPPVGRGGRAVAYRSQTQLSPARMAISLLLESPVLVARAADWALPDIGTDASEGLAASGAANLDDRDLGCLKRLVEHLKSRPQASFHSVLGFWGGRYGLGAQKQLAEYVASQFLGSAKRAAPFDAAKELDDAYWRIRQQHDIVQHQNELDSLINLPELTPEQKIRYKELLLLKNKAHQIPH